MDNLDILSVTCDKVGALGITVIFSDKNTGKKYEANIFTSSSSAKTHSKIETHEPMVDLHEYIGTVKVR